MPSVYAYVMLQAPPVLSGRAKHRFELLEWHRKMHKDFCADTRLNDLKKSHPIILSDGDINTVLRDLRQRDVRLQVLIWSALGREQCGSGHRMDREKNPFQFDEGGLKLITDSKRGPRIIVVCHKYGAASTAAALCEVDGVAAVIYLKHELLRENGAKLFFDVILPVLREIECGACSVEDIRQRMGSNARKFFKLRQDSGEQWGVLMKSGAACPQWRQEHSDVQEMVRVSMRDSGCQLSNIHSSMSKSSELNCLRVCDICTVSRLIEHVEDGLVGHEQECDKVTIWHVLPQERDLSRSRCVVNDVCFSFLGSSEWNVVWRIAEEADWDELKKCQLSGSIDLHNLLWVDVGVNKAMLGGLAAQLTDFCRNHTHTVLLLTSSEDCSALTPEMSFEEWDEVKPQTGDGMPTARDTLSTSIEADSLHGEIKVYIKEWRGDCSGDKCFPLKVISANEFVGIFEKALPLGFECPIAGVYEDDDQSLLVRIGFSCVGLVHRLR